LLQGLLTFRRERFTPIAGGEAIARADEVRAWLKDHPQRRELLFYIGHDRGPAC